MLKGDSISHLQQGRCSRTLPQEEVEASKDLFLHIVISLWREQSTELLPPCHDRAGTEEWLVEKRSLFSAEGFDDWSILS